MRSRVRVQALMGAGILLVGAATARAQEASKPSPEVLQARYQIAVMEAALEQAVRLGASQMNLQLQSVAPDMVFLTGSPRARGFRLDDYGVFFHVDVPVMRRSLAWTFRALRQHDGLGLAAIRDLRRKLEEIDDPTVRQELEPAVRRIEQTMPVRAQAIAPDVRRGEAPIAVVEPGTRVPAPAPVPDPSVAYTESVKAALINAMLEYSERLSIGSDEWLTIAARDQEGSRLEAGDPYGTSTIVLRVKGSDLQAFHSGKIDAAEARKRVEAVEK
ncbi:MAG TPA: hypothetical protein VNK41_11270 [Vicinamibacterales bacterium]|nr:hypothetical protein [Vicinamibacterales bacterium]